MYSVWKNTRCGWDAVMGTDESVLCIRRRIKQQNYDHMSLNFNKLIFK